MMTIDMHFNDFSRYYFLDAVLTKMKEKIQQNVKKDKYYLNRMKYHQACDGEDIHKVSSQ